MYGVLPADILAELLLYLNEHESFESLRKLGTISRDAFGNAIQALAKELKKNSSPEPKIPDFRNWNELAKPYREILAKLSPREAKLLLKGLGH